MNVTLCLDIDGAEQRKKNCAERETRAYNVLIECISARNHTCTERIKSYSSVLAVRWNDREWLQQKQIKSKPVSERDTREATIFRSFIKRWAEANDSLWWITKSALMHRV